MEGDMERHSALPYPRCARARRQRTYLDGRYRVCRCYAMKIPGKTLRTPAALLAAGLAPPERLAELERVAGRYAVAITPALMDLMDPGDPDDPVGRQFVPIAAPSRVTPALVRALKASGKAVYVAVHVNHPRELGADARRACARFVDAGIPLLSQTVLLRGVNDDAQVLGDLTRALVECR